MLSAVSRLSHILTAILAMSLISSAVTAQVTLLGVQYRPDQAFPEHECLWHESQLPGPCGPSSPLGGSIHLFLRNTGSSSVTVQDVVLAGMSLNQVLALHYQVEKRQPASIWLASLTQQELETMLDAGEPVWYKADPIVVPPGSTSQVMVRLRQAPQVSSLSVDVVHAAGTISATVSVEPDQPRPVGAYFSSDLTKAYVYWRRAQGGGAPTTVWFDGSDVTANTTTGCDPAVSVAVSVLQFAQPLSPGTFHVFQGIYDDGQTATAGARAWSNPFLYGMWGAWPGSDGDFTIARNYILDVTDHNINAQMVTLGSPAVQSYLKTAEGMQFATNHGLGFVVDEIGQWSVQHPHLWFIRDEPDAADSRVTDIPEDKKVGSLAQMGVGRADYLRAGDPAVPTILNLDMTYKPFNWYNYGQLPDVLASDPYYQARLRTALWTYPELIALYAKATYVYAVSQLAQSAAEPNPLHIILYACEYVDTALGRTFPFPTPQSKRIEVYYALAAGAKGLSYWWYIPSSPANGVGDAAVRGDPTAGVLWKEMGLLGAEARTAAPILVTSCPATLPMQASAGLWARALLAGLDTLVLVAVNDQYYNDEQGCHYTPLSNASLTVDLPTWLGTPTAFEVAAAGIRDVTSQLTGNGLQISLGSVDLTRMIVVTSNTLLRNSIEQRYTQQFRSKVCLLAPELCTGNGPNITQQPVAQDVCPGAAASFTVAASGSGTLSYRWQKNGTDVVDDGHYSGCTTATLTLWNADSNDAANYRCVVVDANGSNNSNQVALSLKAATAISQHPQTQSVSPGGTVSFSVSATGDGNLSYQWQKNGTNLVDAGHCSGVTTATLTVSNAGSKDAANYRCVVAGGCGSVTSDEAALTLIGPAMAPADFDHDGDVDQKDFGHMQECISGRLIPQTEQACEDCLFDPDADVDADDLAIFSNCLSGPDVPADPNCAGG